MADATAGEDGSNPFSFKSFLKRGEGGTSYAETDQKKGERKSDKPGVSKKKTASKKTPIGGTKKSSSEENPFLFTKFVERKSSKVQPSCTTQLTSSSGGEEDSSLTVVNQFPPSLSLPLNRPARSPKTKPARVVSSKSPTTQQRSMKQKNSKPSKLKKEFGKGLNIFDLSDASDSDSNVPPPLYATPSVPLETVPVGQLVLTRQRSSGNSSSTSSPKSPRGQAGPRMREGVVNHAVELPFDDAVEMRKLQAENERLKRYLNKTEEALEKEKEKNVLLKIEVEALKKKEAEDTQALEDMVQKVESNLVATTKRAVEAEATITKLTQEVATVQFQLSQSSPQAVHHHYEKLLRGAREKSGYASKLLLTASQMADRNIRELTSGVESLKNVAEILQFIDNISEVRTTEEQTTT